MWLSEKVAWKLDPHLLKMTRGRLGSSGPSPPPCWKREGRGPGGRGAATLYFNDGDR